MFALPVPDRIEENSIDEEELTVNRTDDREKERDRGRGGEERGKHARSL